MCLFPLFSNGFPSFFYWVLLRFLLGSSLVLLPPFIFLLCSTLFSSGLSYAFYCVPFVFLWVPFIILWVSPCFVMDPLHYSIGFPPSFFNGSPHSSIGFSVVFQCVPLYFLMGSLHSSLGFSFAFYWIPLCFWWPPLLFYWVLLCFLIGSPLFSNAPLDLPQQKNEGDPLKNNGNP